LKTARAGDWSGSVIDTVSKEIAGLMKAHRTPGVSIAAVEDLKITWIKGFGVANARTGERVTTNSLFEAASMSKPLFAYAALKLVEEGHLELDRPLVEYLDEPYLKDAPRHLEITTRMVLSHTTGFPNWRKGGWREGKTVPVNFEPGTKFGYSGEGFLYLQRVVEHFTRERMDVYMKREFLDPIGMQSSSYTWDERFAKEVAAGHDAKGKLKKEGKRAERANAAYTLLTTPAEYARFLIEIMDPRRREHSLSRKGVERMLTRTSHSPSRAVHYGLGWAINTTPTGDFVSHGGSNGTGFRCYSRFDRSKRNGIVIMTNGNGGKALYQELLNKLAPPLAHAHARRHRGPVSESSSILLGDAPECLLRADEELSIRGRNAGIGLFTQ
jgi:CubicO group peptidase (beta-lactamase class C family)